MLDLNILYFTRHVCSHTVDNAMSFQIPDIVTLFVVSQLRHSLSSSRSSPLLISFCLFPSLPQPAPNSLPHTLEKQPVRRNARLQDSHK